MNLNGDEGEINIFQFILLRYSIEELEKRYEILLAQATAAQRDLWFNSPQNHLSILELAITKKMSPKMLLLLIKMGARWDHQTDKGTPLHTLAMFYKEPAEWVELLEGMDPAMRRRLLHMPDDQGNTVLHCLVKHKNFKLIKLVVSWGVELNIQNKKGESPLHLMSPAMKEYSVLRFLLKAGANPHLLDHKNNKALEDPDYVLARGKVINQWRRKINVLVDENERVKELHYNHDQEARRSFYVHLQAMDDPNKAFSLYVNKLDFHFDGLIRFSHEHRQTRFQLVESPTSIYRALEATEDGSISLFYVDGHGPGEEANKPSRMALGHKAGETTYLSAGDERLIELLQKKMELPDPSLEKREPTKGLIIWDSCGLANGETNMCEEIARRVKGVTVIGSELNTKGFYTRFYPESAIPVRFFGGENGSVEGTVIYEGESRVKYSNYRDKVIIEDHFK